MKRLLGIRNLIVDMDGVLYRGDEPVAGLLPFFSFLRRRQIRFLLATNNSTLSAEQYCGKLERMGVRIEPADVLTSSDATGDYLAGLAAPGTRMYVLGGDGMRDALVKRGFVVADDRVDYVVVGLDRSLTYDSLRRACLLIRAGARFIGTNADPTLPVPEGLAPGAGAILAALQTCTDVRPTVIGKPEARFYELAMSRLGANPSETAAVGDRLDTDILGATHAGILSLLVLSGATTRPLLEASPIRPDLVFDDIGTLAAAWEALLT
jgi:4-nitrophenyl phosphatase